MQVKARGALATAIRVRARGQQIHAYAAAVTLGNASTRQYNAFRNLMGSVLCGIR